MNYHTFHIPVMGLAYTIDTPVKVARFGISSVVSIIEDKLIEQMRRYYYQKINEPYCPITTTESDYRARRITDYLNLMNRIVNKQIERLRESAFEKGSELVQYFEMLPENSLLKKKYLQLQAMYDINERKVLEQNLRSEIKAGCIDVNIMTKLDNDRFDSDGAVIDNGSDAVAALRGYANSELENSSVVFSAGMNPRLYAYLEQLDAFSEMKNGEFVKKIVVKVSDYRSSIIQGKYLAKKGLWVSEFRVESGLNCGGHAFASDGIMLGPILEDFKNKRGELANELFDIYCKALTAKGKTPPDERPAIKITVQGGIGTAEEDEFLREYYELDATGWGSPFMLVPEAVTVDDETLKLLSAAGEQDIVLSNNSPLGVPFNYLTGASGEKEKFRLADEKRPGSPCSAKLLQANTEFTMKNICTASATYIKKKLQELTQSSMSEEERQCKCDAILTRECLCVGLSNSAIHKYNLSPVNKTISGVTACPGPNLAYFDKITTLKKMVDHIYGRINLLRRAYRPHMFVNELKIYISYLREQISKADLTESKPVKYYRSFCQSMHEAVNYYSVIADRIFKSASKEKELFINELHNIEQEIKKVESRWT